WQVRGILAALNDGYPEVRERALRQLAQLLDESRTREWRENSRQLLTEKALGSVIELLKRPDYTVRVAAARVLGTLKSPGAEDALVAALQNDEDSLVRQTAARALGVLNSPGAGAALVAALKDAKDPFVRVAAAGALGALKSPGAETALGAALKDDKEPPV